MGRCTATQGFGAERRVRQRAQFRIAQRLGRKVVRRHFILLVYAREAAVPGPARLGLVVSKRVGNAVRRNRTKRVIREAFRRSGQLFPADFDFLVIARPSLSELGSDAILAEFCALKPALERCVAQAAKDREIRQSRLAVSS